MAVKTIAKTITIVVLVALYTLISGILGFIPSRWSVQKLRARLHRKFCQLGLIVMGVTVNRKGTLQNEKNYLVVSNHLSYLDILIISAQIPSCFVTSVEIKETPILGMITKWAGCVFVERRNRDNILSEVNEITEALREGINIVIFPEATSTNGESVLRFRSPLYNSSIVAQKPILPLCLNYRKIEGEKVTGENRDKLYWYGSMSFTSHFIDMMKLKSIEVDIEFLDPVGVREGSDAKFMAETTHRLVSERFAPCI